MADSTSQNLKQTRYMSGASDAGEVTGWVGWIGFAGLLMILEGIFQAIAGLVGIFQSSFYVITDSASQLLVIQDVQTWGWVNLIVGAIIMSAGFALFSGSMWARTVAVFVALGAAVANMLAIPLYPIWAIMGITLSIFVIYAVVVHGNEVKEL